MIKTKRYLTLFVLSLLVLAHRGHAALGQAPPGHSASPGPVDVVPPWATPPPTSLSPGGDADSGGTIEPELARALLEAGVNETLRVIVTLRQQVAPERAVPRDANRAEARGHLVAALQSLAERTQAPLRAYLEEAQAAGLVESYTPLWIFNGIAVRARPEAIQALASDPAVSHVRLDHWRQWIPAEAANPRIQNPKSKAQGPGASEQSTIRNLQPPTSILHSPSSILHPSPSTLQSATEWGIARIRADQVWHTLHISGTGVVVAGMDTGADWLHPALQAQYRGYNPHGPTNHLYSWYDATGGGALYPIDDHGHGTHTTGTAVGRGGIGVAPGAQWIAVKVLDSSGSGYDSWIHQGFQWVLAPGGDPARAPDVVNCSWGNDNGYRTVFQEDLRALRAAGIFPVFSNGNDGPGANSVNSPASLPEAFAVGATDEYEEVVNFSSRGPSPWGEIRPHVVAPGVHVHSSLPGGAYGLKNGTSMAAPHVSGIAALLRSVSPTVSITHTAFIITSTAVPLGDPIPNNDTGWGRVDAFAAVAALAHPAFITGTVRQAGDGTPIAGATVAATPHGGGGGGTATTDDAGAYRLVLAPATYDLAVSAFGYEPATAWGVELPADATVVANFSLHALPTGMLRGQVTDAATGQPVTATVAVWGTPLEVITSTYAFDLPAGTYTLSARRLGHRVVTATATVAAGGTTVTNLALPPAPSILLVDSGRWHYGSQAGYFRQALDDLAYTYEEWPVRQLPDSTPTASGLAPYDVVVWSAPLDAPGYIGAEDTISGYLSAGGRLFLSGQDVGFWDGGGVWGYYRPYYEDYLKTRYVKDNAPTRVLDGLGGDIFAGLTITIAGPGGADNQNYPDVIAVADPDHATPVLAYREDGCGGVRVGTCLDYRVVYLSFGFEAINDRAARRQVMDRALAWLAANPPVVGLELTPGVQTRIGSPGTIVTHALRVRHVGQAGITDTVSLSLDGASWPAQLSDPSLTLVPCASATVLVTVTVPATAGWDMRDVATLTARSTLSPTVVQTAVLTSKVPAPILLVDDDRWYNQEQKYEAAMSGAGLPYDIWHIATSTSAPVDGSPPLEALQPYPVVVWWTGRDWYAPVTKEEEVTLADYLDRGGRLFLSSQDFLYHHHGGPFSRKYLGVLNYTEDVTPTLAVGVPGDPIGDGLGPWKLDYPFRNWSDGVEPTPGTGVPFRDDERLGIALARREAGHAAAFFAFPFEALPEQVRPVVMERVVGWLSWLGNSTFSADRGAAAPGDTLTYTLRAHNDGLATVTGSLSNTLPAGIAIVAGSATGPASFDPATRRLSWSGPLGPGERVTFTYQATVVAGTGLDNPIVNTARVGLDDQQIHFHRAARVRVGTPDLAPSTFGCAPPTLPPGDTATCTLGLANAGPGDALTATVTSLLPQDASLIPGSLAWTGGGTADVPTGTVRWAGPLEAGGQVTLTYRLTMPTNPVHPPLYGVAFLDDGAGGAWERATWLLLEPQQTYLPVVTRSE